jgi:hypothetical protein
MRFGGIPLPLLSRSARSKLKRAGDYPSDHRTTSFPPEKRNGSREVARRLRQMSRAVEKDT